MAARKQTKDATAKPLQYKLCLYVTGSTPRSARAIARIKAICEAHLQGRYTLDVVDIYQCPALAKDEQIVATPTLVRKLPAPLRKVIGELFTAENVLFGLDLRTLKGKTESGDATQEANKA